VSAATVTAVGRAAGYAFSTPLRDGIRRLAGLGVEGGAHLGRTVQHRSRVACDPTAPNLRHVHLLPAELHDALAARGCAVRAGDAVAVELPPARTWPLDRV
jgi:hypothetical protein